MARRSQYLELICGNHDFRWLWCGQIVSLLGDWFNTIASVALVASLTDSGLAVGSLFAVRMLAPFFTSPLAGVVADRYSRRRILIVTDVVRGLVVLGMLLVREAELLWLLYVLTAVQLGTSSFFFTARNAILPDIVPPVLLGTANAISSATWSVMLAFGAALGGFSAGSIGIYPSFAIDSLTFFLSGWMVAQIRCRSHETEESTASFAIDPCAANGPTASDETRSVPETTNQPGGIGRAGINSVVDQYAEGLRFLRRHPDVLVMTLHKAALSLLLGTTLRVIQVSIATEVFPVGKQGGITTGLLFAMAGVGTAIGPIAVRYFIGDEPRRLRWAILVGYLVGGLGLAVTASLQSLPLMLIGSLLTGMGNGLLWVFSTQLLMQMIPAPVRGRVFGTEFAMFALASGAGSAIVGVAIDSPLGISAVVASMAALSLIPAIAWTMWLVRVEVRIE